MLLCCWPRCANRPNLHHGVFGRLALEFGLQNNVLMYHTVLDRRKCANKVRKRAYIDMVAALIRDARDGAECSRREHDLVIIDQRVLINLAENVASRYVISNLSVIQSDKTSVKL